MNSPAGSTGDIKYYKHICVLLTIALVIEGFALVWANSNYGKSKLAYFFSPGPILGIHLFFWGALGATVASSLFLADDKELNELENVKKNPDPAVLRYPTSIDVHLYAHRILTSASLAVISALVIYSGLSYFTSSTDIQSSKTKAFFILFAFLVGLYQGNFVEFLNNKFKKILKPSSGGTAS